MRWILALAAALALGTGARAADIASQAGTRAAQFLRFEPGARQAALGGTYAAYGDDVFALWGQPAALADPVRISAGFQHNDLFFDVSQEYIGLILPLRGTAAVGGVVNFVDAGEGLFRATEDATGNLASQGGQFDARDIAASLHYGQMISDKLSGGVALRYIHSEIDDVTATSFSGDAGLRYQWNDRLALGGSVTNVGRGLRYIRIRDDLPWTARMGAAYTHPLGNRRHLLLAGDLWKGPDTDWEAGVGVEARVVSFLSLRLGYRSQGADVDEGITGGAGFRIGDEDGNHADLDYAFVPYGDLGESHRVALSVKWGPWRTRTDGRTGGGAPPSAVPVYVPKRPAAGRLDARRLDAPRERK